MKRGDSIAGGPTFSFYTLVLVIWGVFQRWVGGTQGVPEALG